MPGRTTADAGLPQTRRTEPKVRTKAQAARPSRGVERPAFRRSGRERHRFRIVQEAMSNLNSQTVLSVHHWTDTLFSFTCTRDASFRFENGQFTMVGLEVDGKPLLRAYSLASANYEEHLEFLSIKVPDGPLTSRLQHLKVGDSVLIGKKPTGTLVADNLLPGKTLWLLSTGTGLAPFMSIIKDPDVYDRYEKIVLTHTCRFVDELAYKDFITEHLPAHEHIGEIVSEKLVYYPTVTREEFANRGHITDLIETEEAVLGSVRGAVLDRKRPSDALRQPAHAARHPSVAGLAGLPGRQQQPSGALRRRKGVRRLILVGVFAKKPGQIAPVFFRLLAGCLLQLRTAFAALQLRCCYQST